MPGLTTKSTEEENEILMKNAFSGQVGVPLARPLTGRIARGMTKGVRSEFSGIMEHAELRMLMI